MTLRLCVGVCTASLLAVVLCADIEFPTSADDQHDVKIPLNLVMKLSTLENFTEFRDFLDDQSLEEDPDMGVVNRFGEVDRKAVTVPKNAVCIPELQVVELIKEKDPSLVYFPTCTRLEQCGGCCPSELLKCQPTETEMLSYLVYVSSYSTTSGKFKVKEKKIVTAEKHLKCTCSCAVKKTDCTKLQEYEEDNCRCKCINMDEEKKCRAENDTKIWDPTNCMCTCRQTEHCSTGYYFNQNTCACSEVLNKRRHIPDADLRHHHHSYVRTKLVPLPVLPLYSRAEVKKIQS